MIIVTMVCWSVYIYIYIYTVRDLQHTYKCEGGVRQKAGVSSHNLE
jgi:hypothetical protein